MSQNAQPVESAQPAQSAASGERIVYQARLHWAIFVRPVMLTCLAILLFSNDQPFLGVAAALVAGLLWAGALMTSGGSLLVITERRVLVNTGAIYRVSLALSLDEVDAVTVRQDTMGRLLGYGTLMVDGSDGSRAVCPTVAHADEFRRQFQLLRGAA